MNMNKTHILCILAAFVIGFVFGKSLSIYQIERGPSSGSVQIALKVNTITGSTWVLYPNQDTWDRIR
ncbi:MAG: hypothetical protein GX174_04320 [Lentisphaerae bacterium]|jgi:hypothetical protein|nr:hypothetical protein [Lentisphaerota bacterium]